MRSRGSQDAVAASAFTGADVAAILRERSWLAGAPAPEQPAWCERAAALLGPHASDRAALSDLLGLIFHYDAAGLLSKVENHVVLSRYGARDVLRHLALLLLEPGPLTTERFKEIISALKESLQLRGRELFHPIRLALAGRAGEGELDRVILLLDEAAALPFATPVKPARNRILEFCASLD
jgi:nondiscriminating glutamyl-tRNA synthetase